MANNLTINDLTTQASGYVASPDRSRIPRDPNNPLSTPRWELIKKIQRALKDLPPKEYERRKRNGTLPHPGMTMEELEYYYEDLQAGKAPDRGHPDTHDWYLAPQEEMMIGRGREPNEDDRPYRPGPRPGDPDYIPPPSFPGQDIPKRIAHGIHKIPDGWSMPHGTHDPREHKQYLPDGSPVYDDGSGNISPWDERPIEISDHRRGSEILRSLPRGGRYGNSHRDAIKEGGLTKDELIKTLKIAAGEFLA